MDGMGRHVFIFKAPGWVTPIRYYSPAERLGLPGTRRNESPLGEHRRGTKCGGFKGQFEIYSQL